MNYRGRYPFFDTQSINTYPVATRSNKVHQQDLLSCDQARQTVVTLAPDVERGIDIVAEHILTARQCQAPVMLFTGAHLIKNGLGLLLADLIRRGLVTLVAGNGATTIHDFELALIGQTSENVPNALEVGGFGMAYEFAYINTAINLGNQRCWGYGESLAAAICDAPFQRDVLTAARPATQPDKKPTCQSVNDTASPMADTDITDFAWPHLSVLAASYDMQIPFTVHVGIGTDVIDQHPSFDGCAKGGCSARDFLIYVEHLRRMADNPGVVLNIGSAVTGPEVLLKAVSMVANAGFAPEKIITADFDIRPHNPQAMRDEAAPGYYCRDQKSVLTRIPQAFNGQGCYIQGNQRQTFVALYQRLTA